MSLHVIKPLLPCVIITSWSLCANSSSIKEKIIAILMRNITWLILQNTFLVSDMILYNMAWFYMPVWNIVIVQSKNTHQFTKFLVSCWSYYHCKYTTVENEPVECTEMHRESVTLHLSLFCFVLRIDSPYVTMAVLKPVT